MSTEQVEAGYLLQVLVDQADPTIAGPWFWVREPRWLTQHKELATQFSSVQEAKNTLSVIILDEETGDDMAVKVAYVTAASDLHEATKKVLASYEEGKWRDTAELDSPVGT